MPPYTLAFLFLDLETTGFYESRRSRLRTIFTRGPLGRHTLTELWSWLRALWLGRDEIVEIGVIGTTADLKPLFEVETMIEPSRHTLTLASTNRPVYDMMLGNGLWADLAAEVGRGRFPSLERVEDDLLTLIDRFAGSGAKVVLAGSGVATFDSRFIAEQMPRLSARLEYFTHDVGVLRREWRRATGSDLVMSDQNKTHRAFDDVLCHLEEARAYRSAFTGIAGTVGGSDLHAIEQFTERAGVERLAA